jgi:replicative DNA helicase
MQHISKKIKEVASSFIGQSRGITTGFDQLDETMWGLQPQKLIVIGGRPGMGKSGIMADMILAASTEVPVGVFSCEMPREQLSPRLACNLANLNYHNVRRGKISEDEKKNFDDAIDVIEKRPIFTDHDNGIVGLDEYWLKQRELTEQQVIDYKLKKMVSVHGCKVIFVDYLQLIQHINLSKKDRRLIVGDIAEALRDYAKKYYVTVVLLSQLRRFDQARYREDGKKAPPLPTLDDLKESGEIENHSDTVILLHRPQYYYMEKEIDLVTNVVEDDALLIVAKNRDGPDGSIKVDWLGYAMSYRDKEAGYGNQTTGEF